MPDSSSAFDVFISHATEDDAIVTSIASAIKDEGIIPWVDQVFARGRAVLSRDGRPG